MAKPHLGWRGSGGSAISARALSSESSGLITLVIMAAMSKQQSESDLQNRFYSAGTRDEADGKKREQKSCVHIKL